MYDILLGLGFLLACFYYYVENKKTYNKLFLTYAIISLIRKLFLDNILKGKLTAFIFLNVIQVVIILVACILFFINIRQENKAFKREK